MSRARIFASTAKWLQRAYERDRRTLAAAQGRPFPKRRRKSRPAPGTIITDPSEDG